MPDNADNESNAAVGARLAKARALTGLDKRQFAERAGISPQAYGPFENGIRPVSLEAAKRLRKTYGLTLEFIYFGIKDDLPHKIATSL